MLNKKDNKESKLQAMKGIIPHLEALFSNNGKICHLICSDLFYYTGVQLAFLSTSFELFEAKLVHDEGHTKFNTTFKSLLSKNWSKSNKIKNKLQLIY